jgi:hypothetical protein
MLTVKGKNNSDGSFDWADALIDASIYSGTSFFTALGALLSQGPVTLLGFEVVACAAAAEWLGFLMVKRKIVKE